MTTTSTRRVSFSDVSELQRTFSDDATIEEVPTKNFDGCDESKSCFDRFLVLYIEKRNIKTRDDVLSFFSEIDQRHTLLRVCDLVLNKLDAQQIYLSRPSSLKVEVKHKPHIVRIRQLIEDSL
jgi:hypothetical protein